MDAMLLQRNSFMFKLLLGLCLLFYLVEIPAVQARIRHYKWEVKYEYKSPDRVKEPVITINGGTPGPTILTHQRDTVVIELKNSLLTETVAIHWQRLTQTGTPWSDGTEGVSRCQILPGDTFKYEFVVDRLGTYVAHFEIQRDTTLYGSIRVELPEGEFAPLPYNHDRSIRYSGHWCRRSTYEFAVGVSYTPFVWIGEPQSQVIQRKGRLGDGSRLATPSLEPGVCNTARHECSPYAVTVVPAKTYRLKVNVLTALSALSLQIEMVVYSRHIFPTGHACKYRLTTPFLMVSTEQMDAKRWWQIATPWILIKGWWLLGGW